MTDDLWNMRLALEQAEAARREGEVPVGAVVVDGDGRLLAAARNAKERRGDPCAHAEMLAISGAARRLGDWRLSSCVLYATLEPCPMCLGAAVEARVARVVFGAYDEKGGALGRAPGAGAARPSLTGGLLHYECSRMLSGFFRERRAGHGA